MARDASLVLHDGNVTANGAGSTVSTEGGFRADVSVYVGTVTGTSPTLDIVVQASLDGGTTYGQIGRFPLLNNTHANSRIARTVYVPRPNAGQDATLVRLSFLVGGTSPNFAVKSYLEPLVSLAVPAADEPGQGLAKVV